MLLIIISLLFLAEQKTSHEESESSDSSFKLASDSIDDTLVFDPEEVNEEPHETEEEPEEEPPKQQSTIVFDTVVRKVAMSGTPKKNKKTIVVDGEMPDMSRLNLRADGEIEMIEDYPGWVTKFSEGHPPVTCVAIDLLAMSGTATNPDKNPHLGEYEVKISRCGFYADILYYPPNIVYNPDWLTMAHAPYDQNTTRYQALAKAQEKTREKFDQVRPHMLTRVKLPLAVRPNPRWSGFYCDPGNDKDPDEDSLIQMVSFEFNTLNETSVKNKVKFVMNKNKVDEVRSSDSRA